MGRELSIPQLIRDFTRHCADCGLRICWWHVTSRWMPQIRCLGGRVAQIGTYALVDLADLTFEGREGRDVRASLRRLPQSGFSIHWFDPQIDSPELLRQVTRISEVWLAGRRLPEISHSLGTLRAVLSAERGLRCLLLLDQTGFPQAFMTFVPLFGDGGGYALDMLRHNPLLPRGSMLFLLASALQQFRAEGHATAALGLAPLNTLTKCSPPGDAGEGLRYEPEDTPLPLRALRGLLWQRSRRRYNFRGLAFFKRRFRPRWEPRYLVYPRLISLPRTLRALCHVHGLRARSLLQILAG
jgi:phosphatidylglycerol lysyltransferase